MTGQSVSEKQSGSFADFCFVIQSIHETRRTAEKIRILSGYIKTMHHDPDFWLAIQYLSGEYLHHLKGDKISLGPQLVGKSASEFLKIDYEAVFRPCRNAMGSTPETISKLMENIGADRSESALQNYTLSGVKNLLDDFSLANKKAQKLDLLSKIWTEMSSVETGIFLHLMNGRLKTGLTSDAILTATSLAFGAELSRVRAAYLHYGSVCEAAVKAGSHQLPEAADDPIDGQMSTIRSVLLYASSETRHSIGLYSELTFGVRIRTGEQSDQEFIPIGKAGGGFSEEDLARLNSMLSEQVLDRFGPTLMLKPSVVIEIRFNEVLRNKRTKAGFSLREPQIKQVLWDADITEVDSVDIIEVHYKKTVLQSGTTEP